MRSSRSSSRGALAAIALFAASLLAACGEAGDAATTSPPLTFSGPPAETVTTASGQLTIDIRWSPQVPAKGIDAAELTFRDSAGNLVDGLDVTAVPWMPAHGHGTSVTPVMMPLATGVQAATPVYFYMSGEWQLRVTIAGPTDDSAVATVEIP